MQMYLAKMEHSHKVDCTTLYIGRTESKGNISFFPESSLFILITLLDNI